MAHCLKCGTINQAHARFCKGCGASLAFGEEPAVSQIPPPEVRPPISEPRDLPRTIYETWLNRHALGLIGIAAVVLVVALLWIWMKQGPPTHSVVPPDRKTLDTTSRNSTSAGVSLKANADPDNSWLPTIVYATEAKLWKLVSPGSPEPVVDLSRVDSYSVSRNGRIAFDRFWAKPPDPNIYYMDSLWVHNAKRVTHDGLSTSPVISPDGGRIAFQRYSRWPMDPPQGAVGRGAGVWVYDVQASAATQLVGHVAVPEGLRQSRAKIHRLVFKDNKTLNDKEWIYDSDLLWSDDGRYLCFTRSFNLGRVSMVVDMSQPDRIIVLPEDVNPGILAFHGTRVLHFNNTTWTLVSYDLATGQRLTLTAKTGFLIREARWSPNGDAIAYSMFNPDQSESIWLVSAKGGEPARKVADGCSSSDWSVDGSQLVCIGKGGLFRLSAPTWQPSKLVDVVSERVAFTLTPRPKGTHQ